MKHEAKCRFQGFSAKVHSRIEVEKFKSDIADKFPETKQASHRILEFQYENSTDNTMITEDDGEVGGGGRILDTMLENNLSNVVIMVCRWYGGKHIYSRR